MTNTEALKKEIDTSGNEILEIQEMEEFLQSEENIKRLGTSMESSTNSEILEDMENIMKNLCENILSQTQITDNQQKIITFFSDKFGNKYPELKEKFRNVSVSNKPSEETFESNLTKDQLKNIEKIKKLGIELNSSDINEIKDLKLTNKQLTNIGKFKECGMKISTAYHIERIKDIELTESQIKNLHKMKKLGIGIDLNEINEIKDIELNDIQFNNIQKLQELGIDLYSNDINEIKDIELNDIQFNNIQKLQELGIDLYSSDINEIKDIELNDIQFNNIQKLQELGINPYSSDINEIKDIELNNIQLNNIQKLQELGIDLNTASSVEEIKDLSLTDNQLKNIKMIKDIGYDLTVFDIDYIKNLTKSQIDNIQKINNLGIDVKGYNLSEIKDLSLNEDQISNIQKINNLGIDIKRYDLSEIKDLSLNEDQISNIQKIKNLGIDIKRYDLSEIKDLSLNEDQISNIQKINNLGIKIYIENLKEIGNLTTNQINNIIKAQGYGIDLTIEDIKKIKDIQLTDEVLEEIKTKDENHRIEAESDYKVNTDEQEILNIDSNSFYEGYNYSKDQIEAHHHYKRGRIIENIQTYVQNVISENRNIGKSEILNMIRSDLITLPINEKKNIIIGIDKVVKKFNTIRKYLNFKIGPYKNPKELLCAICGITEQNKIKGITNNITVRQHGIGLTFFVGDKSSYEIIYDDDGAKQSSGYNTADSSIPELEGTLSVINGKDPISDTEEYNYGTTWHEGQHNRNTYFMPDKEGYKPITRAKDEITAYLREGENYLYIKETLTEENGLYQYNLEGQEREDHKNQVRKLLSYAKDLIELAENEEIGLTRDKIISTLSDTPRDRWKELHTSIMSAFKSNESISDKLRRTGTAEKQDEIDEISVANSIEEIKHIINNPKYSHISRVPNNKGGIEISAIIDEVMVGRLEITFIPPEIRTKVQEFINK